MIYFRVTSYGIVLIRILHDRMEADTLCNHFLAALSQTAHSNSNQASNCEN